MELCCFCLAVSVSISPGSYFIGLKLSSQMFSRYRKVFPPRKMFFLFFPKRKKKFFFIVCLSRMIILYVFSFAKDAHLSDTDSECGWELSKEIRNFSLTRKRKLLNFRRSSAFSSTNLSDKNIFSSKNYCKTLLKSLFKCKKWWSNLIPIRVAFPRHIRCGEN